jgi:periplasmic protein TonB
VTSRVASPRWLPIASLPRDVLQCDSRWSDEHPFLLALAVSLVAHVLFFVFGPTVKVPVSAPRPVLEVKLIEAERKPPPPPVVVPDPPKPVAVKNARPAGAKPVAAKSGVAVVPRLAAQVAPPSQPLPAVQRDERVQPQARVQPDVPVAARADAPVMPRIEARADIAPRPIADLPSPRVDSRPRVEAAPRPDLAPVARADTRIEVPKLEARASGATDVQPITRRDAPAEPRRDVSVPRPDLAPTVRADTRAEVPKLEARSPGSSDVQPITRRDVPAEPRREVIAAVPRPDVGVRPQVAPPPVATVRGDVAADTISQPVPVRPTVPTPRPEPATEPRRDIAAQRPPPPVQGRPVSSEVQPESAATPSAAPVQSATARTEPRPDPRPDPAVASRPRLQDGPEVASAPVIRDDAGAARPSLAAAPAVAELRPEPPPAPRPPTDRPTVAPAPLSPSAPVARATPAPAVSGPAIDPKRDASPRIGGPQGAVVAGARPTLGGVPRGDGYDRAAAVKYAESVATEIQKRIRYPRMAERAGLQGTVELVLTYDARGKFVEARVRKSSGHKSLDDAALEAAVAAMSRMGRAPERTPELSIPYNFKIEDR